MMAYSRQLLLISTFLYVFMASAVSQTKLEGGPVVGLSWYNGDLNPGRQFYNVHPAIGGLIRYSINDRIAFRGGLTMIGISGSYPRAGIHLTGASNEPYSFNRTFFDATTFVEINFFSFDHPHKEETEFTPYAKIGIGSAFYKRYFEDAGRQSEQSTFILSLPFGAGAKIKVNEWIKVGAEWTFRKTFADDLDLVGQGISVDPSDPFGFGQSTLTHNNDWYSSVTAFMTFRLFSRRAKCHDGF